MPAPYSREFFDSLREGVLRSANAIVPIVLDITRANSVVDVGCGTGTWLAAFAAHGVQDILGLDGDYVDRSLLEIPAEQFVPADLNLPLSVGRRFDLVVSLEVAEHLQPAAADTFVDSLTRLGPIVLFSAAIPHQGGVDHLNEQWPEYWATHFAYKGFRVVDAIRPLVWNNPKVETWYAQNTLLFVDRRQLARFPGLRKAARSTDPACLARVHPRTFSNLATQGRSDREKGDYYYAEWTRLSEAENAERHELQARVAEIGDLRRASTEAEGRSVAQIGELRSHLEAARGALDESRRTLETLLAALLDLGQEREHQAGEARRFVEALDAHDVKIAACESKLVTVAASHKRLAVQLAEAESALHESTATGRRLEQELQLRDGRIAEQSAAVETIDRERSRLAAEVARLAAEVAHWKAEADLPNLPLGKLLGGAREHVARSVRRVRK